MRLHDPLALLAFVREPVVAVEQRSLTVDADGRLRENAGRGRVADVVTDVDVVRATDRIVALVALWGRSPQ